MERKDLGHVFLNPADQSPVLHCLCRINNWNHQTHPQQIPVHLTQPGVGLIPSGLASPHSASFQLQMLCLSPVSQDQQQRKSIACSLATGAPTIIWPVIMASLSASVTVIFTSLFYLVSKLLLNGDMVLSDMLLPNENKHAILQ